MLNVIAYAVFSVFLLYIFLAVRIPKNVLRSVNKVRIAAGEEPLKDLSKGSDTVGLAPIALSMPGKSAEFPTGYQWGRYNQLIIDSGDKMAAAWHKPARYIGASKGTYELPHTFSTFIFGFLFAHRVMYRQYETRLF